MLLFHGKPITIQFFVQNLLLDGPETRSATGTRSSCVICMCDKDNLAGSETAPIRTTLEHKMALAECEVLELRKRNNRDGTSGRKDAILDRFNMCEVDNAFFTWPFASPAGVFGAIGNMY